MSAAWDSGRNLCTDCHDRAAVLVYLSDGCAAYPNDRFTTLCPQHIHSIQPHGTIEYLFWIDDYWREHFGHPAQRAEPEARDE